MTWRKAKPGKTLSLRPPEGQPWWWMTNTMASSITFRALGIHARRILDFLMHEHASHAGRQNGNLGASFRQLDRWGVTEADVPKGLAELYATGFVKRTKQGLCVADGGDPSRYALTWLPTLASSVAEEPPTHAWAAVIASFDPLTVGNVVQARAWLKTQVKGVGRGSKAKRRLAPQMRDAVPLNCEARQA